MAGSPEVNPYQAPATQIAAAEALPLRAPAGFVDQGTLVLSLTAVLGAQMAFGSINAVLCLAFNFMEASVEHVAALVEASDVLAKLQNGLYFLTLLPFGYFLVRINRNARLLSGNIWLGFSPASMVWWFAVPFLNFFKPYQAVRAVWDASTPSSGEATSKHGILMAWWTLWISAFLFSKINSALANGDEPELQNLVSATSNAVAAGLAVAALLMVRAFHERQQQRAAELGQPRDRPQAERAVTLARDRPSPECPG